ncbi:TolC family outer membrane protein [Alkalimarinus sediminis]|uniref:TolC family outer membrane protein n=1 Tax=Alkalimarinus sediminis TaxID=1632866 RepID=A0A9E8HG60_9ALTE|nr:TolC family outer membrane protein [Alkalimarinus sediminis]UZW74055.1 TolC family outer membrane protein [Alkalimarinus sediminis]
MKHTKQLLATTISTILASSSVFAVDLVTVYEQAVQYDSNIAASRAAYQAEQEGAYQARAVLLPNITANANAGHTDQEFDNRPVLDDSYKTSGYGVSLTQPIFRADAWFNYQSSQYNSKRAEADFSKAQQDLILTTATAYFGVLRAEENLATAIAAEAAFKRQWEQAKERFDVGLIAITEVHESRASYDSIKTSRIRSEGDLQIAQETLSRLTGVVYDEVNGLSEGFPITTPSPNNADEWVNTAYEQNWSIKSAEFALQALDEQLKTEKSGHYPTLDLSANYAVNDFDGAAPPDNTNDGASVSLVFQLPLYQGGGTSASVRRSRFLVEQSRQVLETTRRNVKLDTRSLYTAIKTDIDTVASQKQNIISRESALEATRAGYSVGTRNIVEVLDAERNYFVALRDYANARFDYVIDSLSIKQAAGTLSPQDLIDLNKWLQAARSPQQ